MNIISQFADANAVQNIFSHSPELERFAFEFCKEFNCAVENPSEVNMLRSRPFINLVTQDGLPVGTLTVDPTGDHDKNGKRIPVYFYDSPAVQKAKGSARANRHCRDSTSIKSIITAVKKNKETPSHDSLVKSYANGINYAFSSIKRSQRAVRLDLDANEALALILSYLELDKNSMRIYDASVKEKYKQFLVSQEKYMDSETTFKRFCEGSYLIGWLQNDHHEPSYYVVAEVAAQNSDLTFQTPLKRYKTLMDCPEIAHHVPIIAAWASGYSNKNEDNELKLPRNDHYYPEVDVASGYSTRSEMWYLIPKKPA